METKNTIMVMVFVLLGLLVLHKMRNVIGLVVCLAISLGAYYIINKKEEIENFDGDILGQVPITESNDDEADEAEVGSFENKIEDLMPKEEGWSESNPRIVDEEGQYLSPQKANLMNMPLSMLGMVSNNTKIANYDLRCAPSIKKLSGISPWNNSTVEPDAYRRGMSINECDAP